MVNSFSRVLCGLLVSGFALAQVDRPGPASDFVLPHGPLRTGAHGEFRWEDRLLLATSSDGLTFTRSNKVITDQAGYPSLVAANDILYLYFRTAAIEVRGTLAVGISSDRGKTWVFKHVRIKDGEKTLRPYAADVRVLEGGTFRLCFKDRSLTPKIDCADGTDGIQFTASGTMFERTGPYGSIMEGALTVPAGDAWHTYLRDINGDFFGIVRHGISADGEKFEFGTNPELFLPDDFCYPTSAVNLGDGRSRFYGTPCSTGGIRSILTRDGLHFDLEPGARLALEPKVESEKDHVKDPAVVRLADGSYVMVYVAGTP